MIDGKFRTKNHELATRNVELEKQLEKLLARVKKSETVSKAQLVLFADAIKYGGRRTCFAHCGERRWPSVSRPR